MIANTYVVKPFGISEVKVIALKGDPGSPTQEQVNVAVEEYMDDHPEAQIPDGAVSTAKIADDAVTTDKIDDDAVTTDKVEDEAITTEKMASNTVAPYADNLVSSSYVSDSEPYLFRKTFAGVREDTELVGGSVVWNQLCDSASVTIPNGRKYFMKKGTDYSIGASTGTAITGLTSGSDMVIDLTLMFGSTIADYIYSLETATAGTGVAFFRSLFSKPYYAYNAGEIVSVNTSAHKMVGFNQWDEEWELGSFSATTGEKTSTSNYIRSKNYIPVLPQTAYYFKTPFSISSASIYVFYYDADKGFLEGGRKWSVNQTTPTNARYMMFSFAVSSYGSSTYNNDICINISDPSKNGTYEPYKTHSYPLDSSLTLRGIPKLDASNNLYYDGDVYPPSGQVERKWTEMTLNGSESYSIGRGTDRNRISWDGYESVGKLNGGFVSDKLTTITNTPGGYGSADWQIWGSTSAPRMWISVPSTIATADDFKAYLANNPITVQYELATPTTETADPYTNPQKCYPDGTEEYIDTREVPIPVGHNTKYMRDLKKLLEGIPDAPSANGTYVLKATVSSSGVTYSWVEG